MYTVFFAFCEVFLLSEYKRKTQKKKAVIITGGGRINEVIRIKHVRRIKHAFEKWVFCFFLRRIKHVRVLFDFLNFSCVVTR